MALNGEFTDVVRLRKGDQSQSWHRTIYGKDFVTIAVVLIEQVLQRPPVLFVEV